MKVDIARSTYFQGKTAFIPVLLRMYPMLFALRLSTTPTQSLIYCAIFSYGIVRVKFFSQEHNDI